LNWRLFRLELLSLPKKDLIPDVYQIPVQHNTWQQRMHQSDCGWKYF